MTEVAIHLGPEKLSFIGLVAAGVAASLMPWKYVIDRIRGTAKLENKKDTACVAVGVGESKKYGNCPGARYDSNRMGKLLSKYGATKVIQDGGATVSAVSAALAEACRKPLCVFFYSGHGGRVRNPKAEDGSGFSEYLALNNGPLYDYDIWKIISGAKGRVVLIFDCCHSATMYRGVTNDGSDACMAESKGANGGFRFISLEKYAGESALALGKSGGHNVLVWSGCPADNYSYGGSDGGVLTNGILSGYRKGRTYKEVWARAKDAASSQNPVRTVLGTGFDGKVFR